jgi:agmatine/peptidylarginine deiminase
VSLYQLPAEWAAQDAVLLTWPHPATDWAENVAEVEKVFFIIAAAISQRQSLIVLCHNDFLLQRLQKIMPEHQVQMQRTFLLQIPNNDSWARDHGPITVYDQNGKAIWLNFDFTAWGNKFDSKLDNQINGHLFGAEIIKAKAIESIDLVLEGGAIETDGKGVLLANESCLLHPNRNPQIDKAQLEHRLAELFGIQKFLWLQLNALSGDDTDGHIDTLARFTPQGAIVHVSCDDAADEHYQQLQQLAQQLAAFTDLNGRSYPLVPLPWPAAKYDKAGSRLPASYANYLIINGAVLVPTYQDAKDAQALAVIAQAYPGYSIIGIDCLPLIRQRGSLHCVTMQFPRGVL